MSPPVVSAIIPTYNRARDVRIAVASAVAQTYPAAALEIVVVDDGGRDDTEAVLAREFGSRIRYLRKPNGGVSAARNHGMAHSSGAYLALLDDDDEWRPSKIEAQARLLDAHPELGLVLTDVEQMTEQRETFEIYRRRRQFPHDGWVLHHVMRRPSMAPSSAMFRRAVFDATGGFDTRLRTAEDIDFLLRVAVRFQIGVIHEPLTRAMRGHDGLSNLSRTYGDYIGVIERFMRDHEDVIDPADSAAALFWAYSRNARGLLWADDFATAARLAGRAAVRARTPTELRELGKLGVDMAKNAGVRVRRWARPGRRRT
jgi:glycosyltransferase involved in cell wall biosynthesis